MRMTWNCSGRHYQLGKGNNVNRTEFNHEEKIMGKGQNGKKKGNNQPAKTIKEKKEAKRKKKEEKEKKENPGPPQS